LLGIKHIIFTIHGWAFNEDRPWWQKKIIRFLYWITLVCAHETIAVSDMVKQQAPDFLGSKSRITIIHNGIEPSLLQSKPNARAILSGYNQHLKRVLENQSDICIVGMVGELHPIKAHIDAITAYATIRDAAPKSILIIIGEGELHEKIQKHIDNLGLSGAVFLLGHIPEAAKFLKAFDIFVLSSHSEALGYVVLEAGLAGIPVIATKVGGIPEIITDETKGMLVPVHTTRDMAQAIDTLLRDRNRREKLGKNLEQNVCKNFSLDRMIDATCALYS
jgi:glycosyltransferase involved in cell wall biosynthesis